MRQVAVRRRGRHRGQPAPRTASAFARPALWVWSFLIALLATGVPYTHAEQATPHNVHVAGIVIDYGDGRVTYAVVPFTEPELSGIEMLNRSGVSLLSIPFGGLGGGVCAIEDTGCDVAACRTRLCQTGDPDSPYWQYAHLGEDGAWIWSSLGASSRVVTDGAVDAWSWSSSAPDPAISSIDELAAELEVDLNALRHGNSLDAITMTTGGDPAGSGTETGQVALAAAIVGSVVVLAGLAIVRSRRQAQ